jgi:type IV secretory pathway VirB4 component
MQASSTKKGNPNSAQNSLEIAEIRDGIVIMKDGSFRSVVMVKAINFDLMSGEERESVEFAYQGFLNSLYFPIQIFIHSERVDIKPYLDLIQKIRANQDNMLLALLMDDYLEYMYGLSQEANIMDKQFYVVVPYSPDEELKPDISSSKNFFRGLVDIFSNSSKKVTINEPTLIKAKDELRNRVQALLSGLQQSSIQGIPLDTQELIELYYNTYNPDTSVRQQLKDFDGLSTSVVTKGEGTAFNQSNNGAVN